MNELRITKISIPRWFDYYEATEEPEKLRTAASQFHDGSIIINTNPLSTNSNWEISIPRWFDYYENYLQLSAYGNA